MRSLERRRNRELYSQLSTRHANGGNALHFGAEFGEEECIIKLVPGVLECIERLARDRAEESSMPLLIIFELIKSWKMPELFAENFGGGS